MQQRGGKKKATPIKTFKQVKTKNDGFRFFLNFMALRAGTLCAALGRARLPLAVEKS